MQTSCGEMWQPTELRLAARSAEHISIMSEALDSNSVAHLCPPIASGLNHHHLAAKAPVQVTAAAACQKNAVTGDSLGLLLGTEAPVVP